MVAGAQSKLLWGAPASAAKATWGAALEEAIAELYRQGVANTPTNSATKTIRQVLRFLQGVN